MKQRAKEQQQGAKQGRKQKGEAMCKLAEGKREGSRGIDGSQGGLKSGLRRSYFGQVSNSALTI